MLDGLLRTLGLVRKAIEADLRHRHAKKLQRLMRCRRLIMLHLLEE